MLEYPFDPDCDFCRIAAGLDKAVDVICEGDDWIAFFPLEPALPGHTLVIPRPHVPEVLSLEPPLAGLIMNAAIQVGRAISSALEPDGINLITSSGAAAEQTVFHVHLHVVPRWHGDDFGRIWPESGNATHEEIEDARDRVRAACNF